MNAAADRLPHLLELYKGLVEVSALINGITDSAELMPAILDVARRVLQVEAASLFLVNPEGALELAHASGGTPLPAQRLCVPRGQGIAGWVLEKREPLLVPDAYADARFYRQADQQTGFRSRSILCVPLARDGVEIGVLQGLNPVGREAFDEADLEAFVAYGNLAATAIDKLRIIEREREQQRLAQEAAFARDIQESFLPRNLPARPGLAFAARYRPARNVGGDFYDVIEMGPDEFFFVIGDVSGKGTPAALLMAQAMSILRLILTPGLSPVTALARWNEMLCGHTIRGMFITAIVGRAVPSRRHVELSSAGHCAPVRAGISGGAREEAMPGSPPLAILPEIPGRSHQLVLGEGEWLVLFTDGLTESFNESGEALGEEGIHAILGKPMESASAVVAALEAGELLHRGGADPHDDLTILAMGFQ